MLVHAQLSVLALAALVACAAARPDTSYHAKPNYPTKGGSITKTANAVQILEDPLTERGKLRGTPVQAAEPQATNLLPGNQNVANLPPPPSNPLAPTLPPARPEDERVIALSSDEVPELFRDDTKPVNKRYPHAVLFGGTCGGSIIHPKWVLTAGHCTLFTGGRYVLAGTNHSEDGSGITKKVKKLHIHPLFSVGPYWLNADNYGIKQVAARWDFLLAELEEPFDLDGVNVAAIPLDDQPIIAPKTYVGYAGYGTEHHGGFMRSEMHAMHLQTQPDSVCRSALEQYRNKDMLCAKGYEPNFDSACNGDSGSGLVDGRRLVGIASWVQNDAFECAKGNLVVFSRVAAARDWIRSIANV